MGGFFNDAKKDLYGPEGSSQGAIPKSMEELLKAEAGKGDQSDMLKEFGKMLGNETDDPAQQAEIQRSLEQLMNYQNAKMDGGDKQDAPKKTKPKAPQNPVPEHSVATSEDGKSLVLSVQV